MCLSRRSGVSRSQDIPKAMYAWPHQNVVSQCQRRVPDQPWPSGAGTSACSSLSRQRQAHLMFSVLKAGYTPRLTFLCQGSADFVEIRQG